MWILYLLVRIWKWWSQSGLERYKNFKESPQENDSIFNLSPYCLTGCLETELQLGRWPDILKLLHFLRLSTKVFICPTVFVRSFESRYSVESHSNRGHNHKHHGNKGDNLNYKLDNIYRYFSSGVPHATFAANEVSGCSNSSQRHFW